jgi:anti-sigma factor RsiW
MTDRNLTCDALDAALADYLEGTLSDSDVADVELHLSGCTRCAALVRDLESITRTAAALPALAPSHDLWPGIAARLDATVIPMDSRRPAPASTWRRLRLGAVAAGLVAITSLVTYSVTRQQMGAPTVAAVAPVASGDSAAGNREPGTVPQSARRSHLTRSRQFRPRPGAKWPR